ncbi:DNA adenine methylase [Campylobacter sp. faydin G-24]|uniref:site-specific DNA-methyltransferase (adenine-specific) n=1 Tax=Campylobacter anatolicus TaxID=2829105 RepID=A0ABS5HFY4_9BACT|nr:DNA adenine methylase [Campylobacter anatolicus]MBR8462961.1 DNA adenine methylase [Campylobacter anatolicus]
MAFVLSPLRYPGGKSKLTDFVYNTIELNNIKNPIYCEPFCGGAGVAINLLLQNKVEKIILNDYDIAIYSLWKAVLDDTKKLGQKIISTKITIQEREKQKQIYKELSDKKECGLDLAFATLFLNRTSVSGIIKGGAIGGKEQKGQYKVDARFNKEKILEKINHISTFRSKIELFNLDCNTLINTYLKNHTDKNNLFIFFDPPYYKQGKNLYTNFFTHQDHEKLGTAIKSMDDFLWILTYDNTPEIYSIYKNYNPQKYKLQYSAKNKIKETELFFNSPKTKVESFSNVDFEAL